MDPNDPNNVREFEVLRKAVKDAADEFRKLRDANPDYQAQVQTYGKEEANKIFRGQRAEENQRAQQQAQLAQQQAQAKQDADEAARKATPEARSRAYDTTWENWRDHHSQHLPDGTWGLASEYNARVAKEYQAQTGVDLNRAWQQDEERKQAGLDPTNRETPLPPKAVFEPQSSHFKESDTPPEKPADYVPPNPK
jgi:hypothetical protein